MRTSPPKRQKSQKYYRQKKLVLKILLTAIALSMAVIFLAPIVLTITNSFMTESEITANYGVIFGSGSKSGESGAAVTTYIFETVNLKFIPDMVSFGQYWTVLLNSPSYLLKFWNSVFLTVPIVVFQVALAALAGSITAVYVLLLPLVM